LYERSRSRSDRKQIQSENQKLRRENAQLRKQLQRLNAAVNSLTYHGFQEEDLDTIVQAELPPSKHPCPECGQPTGEVELGIYTYLFCSACSYRERKSG
jgi:hypothetical protein